MINYSDKLCPCGRGEPYEQCCKRFHRGDDLPEDALQLMRSRYSAYALNLPEYLIKTTHPASPYYLENKFAWKRSLSQRSKESSFKRLEILDFQEKGLLATVTFTAFVSKDDADATFTEISYFEKFKGRWLYLRGQLYRGYAPEVSAGDPLKIMPLAYYGELILQKEADPVVEIDASTKLLIEEMIETMKASSGIGIAAPQVHRSVRIFIAQPPVEFGEGKLGPGEIEVYINPKLSQPSDEMCQLEEGCLSIPTIRAMVSRPKEITIEYTTLDGSMKQKKTSGWEARVIQHEYDHIDGVLFIDRLDPKERAALQTRLEHLKERTQGQ
jgi:peptide deformylase